MLHHGAEQHDKEHEHGEHADQAPGSSSRGASTGSSWWPCSTFESVVDVLVDALHLGALLGDHHAELVEDAAELDDRALHADRGARPRYECVGTTACCAAPLMSITTSPPPPPAGARRAAAAAAPEPAGSSKIMAAAAAARRLPQAVALPRRRPPPPRRARWRRINCAGPAALDSRACAARPGSPSSPSSAASSASRRRCRVARPLRAARPLALRLLQLVEPPVERRDVLLYDERERADPLPLALLVEERARLRELRQQLVGDREIALPICAPPRKLRAVAAPAVWLEAPPTTRRHPAAATGAPRRCAGTRLCGPWLRRAAAQVRKKSVCRRSRRELQLSRLVSRAISSACPLRPLSWQRRGASLAHAHAPSSWPRPLVGCATTSCSPRPPHRPRHPPLGGEEAGKAAGEAPTPGWGLPPRRRCAVGVPRAGGTCGRTPVWPTRRSRACSPRASSRSSR